MDKKVSGHHLYMHVHVLASFLFQIKHVHLLNVWVCSIGIMTAPSIALYVHVLHTCRCGPLVHMWCMRYESKHSYFKHLARVVGNFKISWKHWLYDIKDMLVHLQLMEPKLYLRQNHTHWRKYMSTCTMPCTCTYIITYFPLYDWNIMCFSRTSIVYKLSLSLWYYNVFDITQMYRDGREMDGEGEELHYDYMYPHAQCNLILPIILQSDRQHIVIARNQLSHASWIDNL